jgi:hypothetical protein
MSTKAFLFAAAALAGAASVTTLPATAATDPAPVPGTVMFWLMDRNGDGAIDRQEIEALRAVVFDSLDLDKNGSVTKEEVGNVGKQIRGKIADRNAERIKDGPKKRFDRRDKLMAKLGLDQPGGIAKAAFVSRDTVLFAEADENNDGRITVEEFAAVRDGMRGALMPE